MKHLACGVRKLNGAPPEILLTLLFSHPARLNQIYDTDLKYKDRHTKWQLVDLVSDVAVW